MDVDDEAESTGKMITDKKDKKHRKERRKEKKDKRKSEGGEMARYKPY